MAEDTNVFKKRIREERERLNLSQKQLSEKCGIGINTYQSWEIGRRTPQMNSQTLAILAKFFRVSPLYLLGKTDFRNKWEKYDSLHEKEKNRIRTELQFTESAKALGFYHQGTDNPERDYEEYMNYNRMYQERKEAMKTRSEIRVIIGATENRIIENFGTGEITIQVINEEDVEKGFQQLIRRGIIAE